MKKRGNPFARLFALLWLGRVFRKIEAFVPIQRIGSRTALWNKSGSNFTQTNGFTPLVSFTEPGIYQVGWDPSTSLPCFPLRTATMYQIIDFKGEVRVEKQTAGSSICQIDALESMNLSNSDLEAHLAKSAILLERGTPCEGFMPDPGQAQSPIAQLGIMCLNDLDGTQSGSGGSGGSQNPNEAPSETGVGVILILPPEGPAPQPDWSEIDCFDFKSWGLFLCPLSKNLIVQGTQNKAQKVFPLGKDGPIGMTIAIETFTLYKQTTTNKR